MIWVRSQDRKNLTQPNDIYIRLLSKNKYQIYTNRNSLGEYSSEEKALKVLDMIQSFIEALAKVEITSNMIVRDNGNNIKNILVFQMPLDSEVSDDD